MGDMTVNNQVHDKQAYGDEEWADNAVPARRPRRTVRPGYPLIFGLLAGYLVAFLLHSSPASPRSAAPSHVGLSTLTHGVKAWIPTAYRVLLERPQKAPHLTHTQPVYQSQSGQDAFIEEHFFRGLRNGTFLELGGADGWSDSNSAHFEFDMGWSGVLVEASPASFAKLIKNRPNALAFNAAVCAQKETLHFVGNQNAFTRTIWEFASEEFRREMYPEIHTAADVERITIEYVTCMPVHELLEMANIRHLDLWSLDVEGAEYEVMKTFDFDHVSVDLIVLEVRFGDPDVYEQMRALLQQRGFVEYQGQPTAELLRTHPQSENYRFFDQYWMHKDFVAEARRRRGF